MYSFEYSGKRCARAAGACLLAPESEEGPYYWNSTVRQDITQVFLFIYKFIYYLK